MEQEAINRRRFDNCELHDMRSGEKGVLGAMIHRLLKERGETGNGERIYRVK